MTKYDQLSSAVEQVAAGKELRGDQLLAALVLVRELRDDLTGWEPQLIEAARELGISWAELAQALGVASRQAAERRYLRLRRPGAADSTADGRVRAERNRRAGERAVASWAKENSATLRRLAAMVSAVEGASPPARQQIDQVHRALGDSDVVILLEQFAGLGPHLKATHPALAEQLDDVTVHTERLRQDTIGRRESRQV
ncbi:HSP18 transcriptional regulator [Saccharomonospora sp. NPDC046836]|uniref:HSP18 transcriptional regulator n=1 Tax=Saccharomonospora sp. NPDC046836 TaxID=3156921 RepID=UPI0033EA08E4